MLRAVETAYGSMPESETPSNDYLSLKAEETETNEPIASPLDEIARRIPQILPFSRHWILLDISV